MGVVVNPLEIWFASVFHAAVMARQDSQRTLKDLFASSNNTAHCSFADNQQSDYEFIRYYRIMTHWQLQNWFIFGSVQAFS